MTGPHESGGPHDPRGPHGRSGREHRPHGDQGQHGQQGQQGPGQRGHGQRGGSAPDGAFESFEPFEPVLGYGIAARGPDPYDESGTYVPEKRTNGFDHDRPPGRPRRVSLARLWAGGVVVALVAALAATVAVLLVRGVLDIPVFSPEHEGMAQPASTGRLALGSALAALAATAVLHLLMLVTPQPGRFLAWIVALGTAAVMLLPFTSTASWEAKAGSAGVFLVIGVVIGTLLATVARTAAVSGDGSGQGAGPGSGRG